MRRATPYASVCQQAEHLPILLADAFFGGDSVPIAKRGNVWLGASGLVMNRMGEWLVVRKTYGGLKGAWSFPAGFVDGGETADAAAIPRG